MKDQISANLDKAELKTLDSQAKKLGFSRSGYVRLIVKGQVNAKEDLEELKRSYEDYQISDSQENFDKFIRVCEKVLR